MWILKIGFENMSLLNAVGALLKPQTPLQQLLEDINFQRNKEMRQLLNDGGNKKTKQKTHLLIFPNRNDFLVKRIIMK